MRLLPTLATASVIAAAGLTEAIAVDISGAGATFPYPIYAKWADAYKKETGNGLNYQSRVRRRHQADQGEDRHVRGDRRAAQTRRIAEGRPCTMADGHGRHRSRREYRGCEPR